MYNKDNSLTVKGFEKINQEIAKRKKERKLIADEINEAKKQGDLSENSAYISALEKLHFNEARIRELSYRIKNASIIKSGSKNKAIVSLGSKVKLEDKDTGNEFVYELVGDRETSPKEGKISISSPVGKALINKKAGNEVKVVLPAGIKHYKVIDIS